VRRFEEWLSEKKRKMLKEVGNSPREGGTKPACFEQGRVMAS
jgi:hypothetical protein